ncbi:MAG: ABC transporter permease [Gemmatimonadaceae bacterium]|nr:ABC transporter permease [Gemmatimonadaceae bacterium]
MPAAVPRFARWLLEAVAPADQRQWLVSDLEEEAAAVALRDGPPAARRWSRRQVWKSVLPLLARRIESAGGAAWRTVMSMWRGLAMDVRLAWRRLLAAPGFAALCIVTLALGIGGNTAVFTLIDRVILKPLPVPRPGELYRIGNTDECCVNSGLQDAFSLFSYDLYLRLRDAVPEIPALAAFQANVGTLAVGRAEGDAPPESLKGAFVSGNYFEMFGLTPAAGRLLSAQDDRPGAPTVAVISHRVWKSRYQGASVGGIPVMLNGVPATIVGVASEGFYGETLRPDPAEIWIPLANEPVLQPQSRLLETKPSHWLYLIGRVPPGVETASLEPRLTATLQQWIAANIELNADQQARVAEQSVTIVPAAAGVGNLRGAVAPSLRLLQVIAAAVLLVACANLANLLVARGRSRRTETSVRVALGAPRSRLVSQLLVESLLLASLGGLAGLLVAYAGAFAIVDLAFRGAAHIPIEATPSASVLLFAVGVSLGTGVIFGVAPAVMGSRSDPIEAMRGAGRTTGPRGSVLSRSLVALQIAVSLVLLTCAALLGGSLARLQAQDFGFQVERRYVVDIMPALGGAEPEELGAIYARLVEQLRGIPGLVSAAMSLYSPMSGDNWGSLITVGGHDTGERLTASWNRVTPDYFETIGTPLLRGRAFTDRDRPGTPLVTVVNQAFATRFFGDSDPIGRRIGFARERGGGVREFEIVGVVGDAKYQDAKVPAYPTFFLPFLQRSAASTIGAPAVPLDRSHYPRAIELHVTPASAGLGDQVRRAIAGVDRRVTVVSMRTMAEQVAGNFNIDRLIARVAIAFGGVAPLLACLGLYGVTAYAVTRRTREIGIRMAIGASPGAVLKTVLHGALVQLGLGLLIGVPAALAAGRLLQAMLYGVSGQDPWLLTLAIAILAVCAVAAGLIPARRAAALDPVRALRVE